MKINASVVKAEAHREPSTKTINYFQKTLLFGCLIGFLIRLWRDMTFCLPDIAYDLADN